MKKIINLAKGGPWKKDYQYYLALGFCIAAIIGLNVFALIAFEGVLKTVIIALINIKMMFSLYYVVFEMRNNIYLRWQENGYRYVYGAGWKRL